MPNQSFGQFYISFPSMLERGEIRYKKHSVESEFGVLVISAVNLIQVKTHEKKKTKFLTTLPTKLELISFRIFNFEKF